MANRHIKPECKMRKSDEKNKQKGAQKDTSENAGIAWMASKYRSIDPDDGVLIQEQLAT